MWHIAPQWLNHVLKYVPNSIKYTKLADQWFGGWVDKIRKQLFPEREIVVCGWMDGRMDGGSLGDRCSSHINIIGPILHPA